MGEWLSAYRDSRWKPGFGNFGAKTWPGETIQWTSSERRLHTGRIELACSDRWLLVEELELPNRLLWLREELVQ